MKIQDHVSIEETYHRCIRTNQMTHAIETMVKPQPVKSGPLQGVGIAIKDNISVKDVSCQAGSKILESYVPVFDATIIKRLKQAGAQIVCKTRMDELGMGNTGQNTSGPPVLNPYDPTRIPGGSSAGSAVLVASGSIAIALGTDTGDSIRQPASYTGVIGVKPTYGRISRYGVIPYASSMDTVGMFTTCIEDACILLDTLQGYDPLDRTTTARQGPSYIHQLQDNLQGKCIGIFQTVMDKIGEPILKQRFDQLISELEKQGVAIKKFYMDPKMMRMIDPVYKMIANAEAFSNHANLDGLRFGLQPEGKQIEDVITQARTHGFSRLVKKRFLLGAYTLYEENQKALFLKAQKIRRLLVQEYASILEQVDGLVVLTTPDIAPLIEEPTFSMQPEDYTYSHLRLANLAGYPSLSMPLGFKLGCPFGLNLTCKPYQEQEMFDIAKGIENIIEQKGWIQEAQR